MLDTHAHQVIMERIAQLPTLKLPKIEVTQKSQSLSLGCEFTGMQLAELLAINEPKLHDEVTQISHMIAHWGREAANCKRAWQMSERNYKQWQAGIILRATQDPGERDPKWKRPTDAQVKAMYRSQPQYVQYQTAIEHSEESYNAAMAVLEGYRAKRDMLRAFAIRNRDESAPRLSI